MLPYYQEPLCRSKPYVVLPHRICSCGAHWHSELEIICILNGTISVTVAGSRYELTKDSFIVIDSGVIHSVDTADEEARILLMEAGYELLGDSFSVFAESEITQRKWDKNDPADRDSRFFAYLDEILRIILSDNRAGEAENDLQLRALLNLFACEILKHSRKAHSSKTERHRTDFLAMQKMLTYAENHYAEALSVDFAAKTAGYEKTRFCQLFRRAIGTSFHQYLNRRRIEVAKELIRSSDLSMAEIGRRVGFQEPKTFSRVFREVCACTPTEYKKGVEYYV